MNTTSRTRSGPGLLWARPILLLLTICMTICSFGLRTARANQEQCLSCDLPVEVSGQFAHYKNDSGPAVSGAPADAEAAFREEIFGHEFSISVPHLPAGTYQVVIGEAELYFDRPEQRLFTVTIGDQVVATNYDIFAAAGGARKAVYLTATVEHQDDSLRGPLTVRFTTQADNAKFNTFEIRNADGTSLIKTKAADLADPLLVAASQPPVVSGPEIWKDPAQPMAQRVQDLIRRMSLAEKVQQLRNDTPAIPRLGVPAYDYWSEALHGVARNGVATVFPQAIGMAATWDTTLIHQEGEVIATEGRAKFNEFTRTHNGDSRNCTGLTFWSPNINIFRDPRWGRGQETYGEDPFLTGQIGVAFIRGVQGDDPEHLKAMACAKHFAVHSGPESERHRFNAEPSERDLYETYLPQFEMAVREGHVGGVMGAYNRVDGTPACANTRLLSDILRGQWDFNGYIVSDCGAIEDIFAHHHFAPTPEAAAADAVKAGCDICCGSDYNALLKALQQGLVSEADIDTALTYALTSRFRLGLFDPPGQDPYSKITIAANDTPEHEALALQAAEKSIVLLKNDGVLPLQRGQIKRIAVIGANADSVPMLLGNYNGDPARPVTILNGIRTVAGPDISVTYNPGCPLVVRKDGANAPSVQILDEAVAAARAADVVIYVGGISSDLEGEEFGGQSPYAGFAGGDRIRIELPPVQEKMLQALQATGKPVIYINCSGSAVAMPWAAAHLPAIVQAWYPGEQGGQAVAEVLFGTVNPAGRLPVTFYRSTDDLPAFEDYSMANRTYRYFSGQPLFAFGHGLSYTKFAYRDAKTAASAYRTNETIRLSFTLENAGARDGDEVAQVYFRHIHSWEPQPRQELCGFTRVTLPRGASARVTVEIPVQRFRYWEVSRHQYAVEPGQYELQVGAASDDIRLRVPVTIHAE
ncbi:MAG TPA: glycoside hydrolase family 3 C-terminal domain-containing protein [Dongiaceae bacterium]|nr:glycoside hydrolase family 3 C-terminal domain-containing protein [Dongiaceae bacterium]